MKRFPSGGPSAPAPSAPGRPLGPGDPGQLLLDVTVQTVPGRWYQLQELDDPENGTYLPLPATNTEATGSETTIRVSLPAGQGLFRAAEFEVEP